ncbi:polysaccharide deacetylase family protein [Geomonas sp. Red69]|uniref:polysaccharide deacetylase family protein n=1 Tax=Geomonas diazotrophica TaxID=2843197 RepID=UPI001C1024C9|nr:polysaccharide deacetylase family protein [Geomonas diazotrophica]MBU5638120.1 polysaccharide deacetylase family protein [Geomonas diazotrophica]
MRQVKNSIKTAIVGNRMLRGLLNSATGDFPKIFVYHRFARSRQPGSDALAVDEFIWQLEQLRSGFDVMTVAACLGHFERHGRWPKQSAIVTVDDGYRDFYDIAFPELAKRGLPATFYVTTGFIDRHVWLWPDMLEHAFSVTHADSLTLDLGDGVASFPLHGGDAKRQAWSAVSSHCLKVADHERKALIGSVLAQLGVVLPPHPPSEYEAVTWDQLRDIGSHGIEIGSHTVSHPILSRVPLEELDREVRLSKRRLEEQLGCEVSTFCYPNSSPHDINEAVLGSVRQHYAGAVFGIDLKRWDRHMLPRMGVTEDREDFLWKLYGGESLTGG